MGTASWEGVGVVRPLVSVLFLALAGSFVDVEDFTICPYVDEGCCGVQYGIPDLSHLCPVPFSESVIEFAFVGVGIAFL
jgi:hypothetical protein